MNRGLTVFLLLVAAGLLVFIFVIAPNQTTTRDREVSQGYLLDFRMPDIRGIEIYNGNERIEIERKHGTWRMIRPVKDFAAEAEVGKLLSSAQALQAVDRITPRQMEERELTLQSFGLENPKQRIDFKGDGFEEIQFGKAAAGEGLVYARQLKSDDVYVVRKTFQELAFRAPDAFRQRRLTTLVPSRITAFTLSRDGGEISVIQQAGRWQIERPLEAEASPAAVAEFLAPVLAAPIQSFIDQAGESEAVFGLTSPRVSLDFTPAAGGDPQRLRIGADAPEEGQLYASLTGREGVFTLPKEVLEPLQITIDGLRSRRLFSVNPDVVDLVSIRLGEQRLELERAGDDWRVVGSGTAAEVIPQRVLDALIEGLGSAEVERYEAVLPEDFPAYGLETPEAEFRIASRLSENTPEATQGEQPLVRVRFGQSRDGVVFARVDDRPELAVLPVTVLQKLTVDPGALRARETPEGVRVGPEPAPEESFEVDEAQTGEEP